MLESEQEYMGQVFRHKVEQDEPSEDEHIDKMNQVKETVLYSYSDIRPNSHPIGDRHFRANQQSVRIGNWQVASQSAIGGNRQKAL